MGGSHLSWWILHWFISQCTRMSEAAASKWKRSQISAISPMKTLWLIKTLWLFQPLLCTYKWSIKQCEWTSVIVSYNSLSFCPLQVVLASQTSTDKLLAVKIQIKTNDEDEAESVLRESRILKMVYTSPFCTHAFGTFQTTVSKDSSPSTYYTPMVGGA